MRKLIYTFEDGRTIDTYAQATEIAKHEGKPFNAKVIPMETAYNGAWSGLKEKYRKYFAK